MYSPARTTPSVQPDPTAGDYARRYLDRVAHGELGALPALGGIVALSAVFAALRPAYLSSANLANLLTQAATISIMAMGLVLVLLLREIDLSVGYAGGVAGAVAALLARDLPWYAAVAAALAVGAVIGLAQGLLVVKGRMPSFIVTLAALLGLQGVVLMLVGAGTTVAIRDPALLAIANEAATPALGWALLAAGIVGYVMIEFRRKRRGLHHRGAAPDPMPLILWRIAAATAVSVTIVYVLNRERSPNPAIASVRGVPLVLPVTAALVMWWTFVLRRTSYGRKVYEIGRGLPVAAAARIRISAFVLCSLMAAIGGIVAVSHAYSVDTNTGGINVLLYAIAAALIGGTSLFGGKGRAVDAVLGGTLMAVIDNGMGQLELSAGVKYVVACVFLLMAVGLDAARRANQPWTRSS